MMYALTLNTEILNQKGVPTRQIMTESEIPPVYGEGFYSVGDVLVRSEFVMSIVKMEPIVCNVPSNVSTPVDDRLMASAHCEDVDTCSTAVDDCLEKYGLTRCSDGLFMSRSWSESNDTY